MDYPISDLLDELTDLAPDIAPCGGVSVRRIQKMTKQKLCITKKKHSNRFLSKAALIAAALFCLSVTALATVTIRRAHQHPYPEETIIGFDNDLSIGALSNSWNAGDWTFTLQAECAEAAGMTLLCTPWRQGQTGSLTTDDAFWLEVWNGSGYEEYPALLIVEPTKTLPVEATTAWQISWEADYGLLSPGHYRLGKTFFYRSPSGKEETILCYAKFRVFDDDSGALYNQYQVSLKALKNRNNWHLCWQVFPESPTDYTSYSIELWKSGNSFAQQLCYLDKGGNSLRQSGALLYVGTGYRMPLSHLESPYVEDNTVHSGAFTSWYTFLSLSHSSITGITQGENTLTITEDFRETVLTLDGDKIAAIHQYSISGGTRTLSTVLTVHNTTDTEITRHIDDCAAEIP